MPVPSSVSVNDIMPSSEMQQDRKYVLGICAMDRKARSKPMRHILNRLLAYADFDIVIFGDKTILDEDIENWPGCDFLICFFSDGFPLEKAVEYVKLRKPYVVNDVCMQSLLWDRRVVLAVLDAIGVPTPPRLVVSRDGGAKVDIDAAKAFKECNGMDMDRIIAKYASNTPSIEVTRNGIIAKGKSLDKPFIEKPVDGEDHNINIYYPESFGGGGRRLFRKIGNKSSEFDPELEFASEEGSYIYESLMMTENCEDIKLYTVGPTFIHAETRKSPTVDGHVKRNTDGKEIRYCTELTQEEEEIARKVSKAFGQNVCGLDLLRVQGKSYVIDVNGWSFVKGNDHYYDQCAKILAEKFHRSIQERPSSLADIPSKISPENSWRLKGFVAVFRHGDRTPKDKFKISVKSPYFANLLEGSRREVVFRQKHQLEKVTEAVDKCLSDDSEDTDKMMALKEILEKKANLPGTKVQLKPKFDPDSGELEKLQLNVKWGGEFTHAGLYQSRDLGENLRKDMNILNRAVMDDIKIYSSSERRVRATADIFARWFLGQPESIDGVISESKYLLDDSNAAKEQADAVKRQLKELLRPGNDLPELMLAQMNWPEGLPQPHVILQEISIIMSRLQTLMHLNWSSKVVDQLQRRWCCFESPSLFKERWEKMFRNFCQTGSGDESDGSFTTQQLSSSEKYADPSWIPELYDSLKYDALHNRPFLNAIFTDPDLASSSPDPSILSQSPPSTNSPHFQQQISFTNRRLSTATEPTMRSCNRDLRKLYKYVKIMFDFIAPQEFGISDVEKKNIGMLISLPLLKSILKDLDDMTTSENPKTRLYFTKESHVHALLNLVYHSGVPTKIPRNMLPELDFLTQITFELYERKNPDTDTAAEYSLRIAFSPGAHYDSVLDLHMDAEHCLKVAPRKNLIPHLSLEEVLYYHKGYLNVPNLKAIQQTIEERQLYYAQEDNQ
ncbi:histidine phosphatase superfamily-domain-containing protein [Halteromyces radiatus]|uniref:histidine phosphatase superfamily-domain-containing protein n=1 Tax=Halteromyces radiatus TaxID=101107 RepID=UPI00222086E5|nr:histidine phosphatase superfamily-domain-containing protein [Halteromyces radiatus]KAI8097695.1 histidine phosphatase superfamily-domain-containing protein [Halteromyces radiatus]